MFFIKDGRQYFYQWDLDRKLVVEDAEVTQVHFYNKETEFPLIVEVKEEDGVRFSEVPNILLQKDLDIRAYAYAENLYTKKSATFEVKKRPKPTNYIYKETDVYEVSEVVRE